MKARFCLAIIAAVLVTLPLAACATGVTTTTTTPTGGPTVAESQQIALDFVENSATYKYDGMPETLEMADTLVLRCPYCWQFVYEFDSRHAGYGDRTGQVLAQVITTHEAVVSVSGGNIDGGTIDGTWDMIKQQEITAPQIQTATH